jgi:tetratricopeptide (TPR) repeat protein
VGAFERAANLYRRLGDGLGLGRSLLSLSLNLLFMGRLDQAATALAEALPVLERASLPKALARYFENMGFLSMLSDDLANARKHYEQALMFYRDAGAERDSLDALGNLADVAWALGDLNVALSGCRETIAMLRKPPLPMRGALGRNLLNLAGILTERGELEEALAAAREGLPLLKDMDCAWKSIDHVALRAALAGRLANAARLASFADSANAAKRSARQPNEARARDRLQLLLRERLLSDELERLFAEGAQMTEDEACQLAVVD